MKRNTIRSDDLEPGAALAATLVALSEAARYSGAGLRTAVRRAASARSKPSRRPRAGSVEAGRRGTVVRRVSRGDDSFARLTPADYLAVGVLAGTTGTIALAVLSRSLLQRADVGPGGAAADVPEHGGLKAGPTITGKRRRHSSGGSRPLAMLRRMDDAPEETPAPAPDVRSTGDDTGKVDAGPEPAPSGKDPAGRRQ
jgi:hypothetical protein